MPRNFRSSSLMKPLVVLALPGMYLFYKYNQYKQQQQEQNKRKVTERELDHLNQKIDKLLTTLEKNDSDIPTSQDDECVICCTARASMQTYPCGHRVVCRKCFVKTIQSAVSQRLLPLRCVICRSKILRLKQNCAGALPERMRTSKSWSAFSTSFSSSVPASASQYSMSGGGGKLHVPTSLSLYSVTSGASLLSGVSSVSSGTSCSGYSSRTLRSSIVRSKSLQYPRQPTGSLRKSQVSSMKNRLQEFREPVKEMGEKHERTAKLTPIQEFQREYRVGRDISNSTRIRCAHKIITQLETTPSSNRADISSKRLSRVRMPAADQQKHRSQTLSCKREKENVQNCSNTRNSISMSRKSSVDSKELDRIELASNASGKTKTLDGNNEKLKEKDVKTDNKKMKELSKAEKKQLKKQAKAEKKRLKEEAKRLAKENKQTKK